jgi:hypothetical protein
MIVKRIALALIIAAFLAIPMSSVNVKATSEKSLVGSWIGTVDTPFFSFKYLMTCTDDGALIVSQSPIAPGGFVGTAGHGEWDKVRSGEFIFAFVALRYDASGATFLGTSKVTGNIHVDGTSAYTGAATACNLDPAGNVVFCFDASLHAERIRVGS